MEDLLKVGIITSTHGLKGEVKVYPTTDDAKRFLDLEEVLIDMGKEKKHLAIEGVRFFKQMAILKFKGIDKIEEAQRYRQKDLYVTREQAVPLGENEYFIADLIGILAVSEDGEELGRIAEVLQSAANDVYIIQKEGVPDLLVPAIKDCVKKVDLEAGVVTIHLLPGLREINYKAEREN